MKHRSPYKGKGLRAKAGPPPRRKVKLPIILTNKERVRLRRPGRRWRINAYGQRIPFKDGHKI
jgi:hypothetical protein